MTLIKWNNPAQRLANRNFAFPAFDSIFRDFFPDHAFTGEMAAYLPAVNIREDEQKFYVELNAAGFGKEDFKVLVEEGVLTISAEHKSEKTDDTIRFRRKEFNRCSFTRSFRLPETADENKVEARYENGILLLELNKKEVEKPSAREIRIA
ncbi:MAG TPA: Hsp20/alpha crystallin family protein [Bacteroidia bacterium]|jgi:HSP20 family protein|nr:Hsp20/alpha crystallin family protein [Bacteroidia bacterium]